MEQVYNVRQRQPLVHCITNYVTMNWVAQGLLAAGARPVMVLDESEAATMARHSDALLLNYGTWSPDQQRSMLAAAAAANDAAIPVVLDPVGAGGLPKRTEAAIELLNSRRVDIVRGNAGEIAALAGSMGLTRGVDSNLDPGRDVRVYESAKQIALHYSCLVIATGPTDLVTDGKEAWVIRGGHSSMEDVVGAGCLVGAVVAAAAASAGYGGKGGDGSRGNGGNEEHTFAKSAGFTAHDAAQALLWCKATAEIAAKKSDGSGSFRTAYLDALSSIDALPEGRVSRSLSDRLALCVIVDGDTPLSIVESLLGAGVPAIEFRDKRLPLREQMRVAERLGAACRTADSLFIVNDHVDVAVAAGADGVHIGRQDLPVDKVRDLMGPAAIVGVSVQTAAEAKEAAAGGADYLGVGPVFESPTKPAEVPVGLDALAGVRAAAPLPIVGIGGIDAQSVTAVIEAGAVGVAVISAVLNASEPAGAATAIRDEVQRMKNSL